VAIGRNATVERRPSRRRVSSQSTLGMTHRALETGEGVLIIREVAREGRLSGWPIDEHLLAHPVLPGRGSPPAPDSRDG
jgi:hypothetical protein